MTSSFKNPNVIRSDFSSAMSRMYRDEVPAYGSLVDIVEAINTETLNSKNARILNFTPQEDTQRISQERHGAIRLGTPNELSWIARVFAVMGMQAVGYYDLSIAAVPVHSTAFRPTIREDLAKNPFRVFTSLLRLELIEDETLRDAARAALASRQILTDAAMRLTIQAEEKGGLNSHDAALFVSEVLETFRWHSDACVDHQTFAALKASHPLTADVVSFKGPHINHLTPRTLDIDLAQEAMVLKGLPAKDIIEGPPPRRCPILLRQTSFKALEEAVRFPEGEGTWVDGEHTARFGEIEQRGVALTRKGRALYDQILEQVRSHKPLDKNDTGSRGYQDRLQIAFKAFPDNWREMFDQSLAFFKFSLAEVNHKPKDLSVDTLLDDGVLKLSPIIYEDFLPVSAAGIFQSNLDNDSQETVQRSSSQQDFEVALGKSVISEFALYEEIQQASLSACLDQLKQLRNV